MPPVVIFLRHGYRLDWDEPDHRSPTGLPHDPALSPTGVQQVEDLALYLREQVRSGTLPPVKIVYSSPFYRTLETATPVARELGVNIAIEDGLSEFFGNSSKSAPPRPAPREVLHKMFPLVDTSYRSVMSAPEDPLRETKAALHGRLRETARRLLERHQDRGDGDGEGETVICVTHAAGVIAAARALVDDPNAEVRSPAASLVKLTFDRREGKYAIVENGTTSHLRSGELRNWSFPDENSSRAAGGAAVP